MPDIFVSPAKKETKPLVSNKTVVKKTVRQVTFPEKVQVAFTAIASNPKDVHFESQQDGEEIVLLLRRHWITNLHWLLITLLLVLSPTIIFPALSFFKFLSLIPVQFQIIGLVIFYSSIFTYFFVSYLSWYFNVYILTDKRVIDVDFYNLLYKEVSTCEINKIQDVTYQTSGFFKVFFDYGTVFIQTAGEEKNLEFEMVPKPALVVKYLIKLIEQNKK